MKADPQSSAPERTTQPDLRETRAILKARALALAQPPAGVDSSEQVEIIEFVLADEIYAIEARFVREVVSLDSVTPLPCTPAFVLGIVNIHGEILSVIDIRKFFDLPKVGLSGFDKLIVLNCGEMRFGILANALTGARYIPTAEIQPALPTVTGIRQQYLWGLTAQRTVLLNAEKLITAREIIVHEQVE
ncbi:MAG: chemotaxis protein CheW [Pseudomonadota bacterium]